MSDKSVDGTRRRNTPGPTTKAISVTIPIELNDKLESMAKPGEKSFLITELLNEALASREKKGR